VTTRPEHRPTHVANGSEAAHQGCGRLVGSHKIVVADVTERGRSTVLSAPSNVLVKDNLIASISTAPIAAEGALRIVGNGRTLLKRAIDEGIVKGPRI
jgi:hypothetical protein